MLQSVKIVEIAISYISNDVPRELECKNIDSTFLLIIPYVIAVSDVAIWKTVGVANYVYDIIWKSIGLFLLDQASLSTEYACAGNISVHMKEQADFSLNQKTTLEECLLSQLNGVYSEIHSFTSTLNPF